jgi:predicted homoserine dehydrogenase-like protein
MNIYDDLKSLDKEKRIRIGLVGAGFMGRGIVEVIDSVPGMDVVAVADIELERACSSYLGINVQGFKEVNSADEANSVDLTKERIVTGNYKILPEIEVLNFIVEATGVPEIGAEVAFFSIMNKKHIGMMNVETDVTVGYYLALLAEKTGVVYTVCTGDEPAALKELCDFSKTLGFEIVACGKGKNNPLDVSATPSDLREKAAETGLNPRMLTEFVDGSKTMVEMCSIANAAGLTVDRRNMHGPHADIKDLAHVFSLRENGGILSREGVVDFAIGDVAPGVFAIVRHEGKLVNETLQYLKMGDGPNYVLYRPYHLTNIEVPISLAVGYLYGKPSLSTTSPPHAEVITVAKKDLHKGEVVDSIGGHTVYGGIETWKFSSQERLLPLGLSEGAVLIEDVAKGDPLTYDQVRLKDGFLLGLRKIQDRLYD